MNTDREQLAALGAQLTENAKDVRNAELEAENKRLRGLLAPLTRHFPSEASATGAALRAGLPGIVTRDTRRSAGDLLRTMHGILSALYADQSLWRALRAIEAEKERPVC